ncbi:MAG: hypothetical protein JNM94_18545 [Phycisphaerae bacterium]|nr:hypothetical protein [Phycisphaerae bacterium]
MGMTAPLPPFRCERCAYDLAGLPADGACPECGLPVAASRPERRPGLSVQRRLNLRTWVASGARVLATPCRAASDAWISRRVAIRLLAVQLSLCVALYGSSIFISPTGHPHLEIETGANSRTISISDALPVGVLGGLAIPVLLLAVVPATIRTWYRRKSPPVRDAVVWTNISLTTYAFVASGVIVVLLRLLWLALAPRAMIPLNVAGEPINIVRRIVFEASSPAMFLGMFYAAYIDWRMMKVNRYANPID